MKKPIKKTISSVALTAFVLHVVLPLHDAKAMTVPWWYGSQAQGSVNIQQGYGGEGSSLKETDKHQQGGEPVFIHNGDFVYEHEDLVVPSRAMNTEIERIYKSQSRYNNRFGYGWDMFYNKRIVALCTGDLHYLNGKLNRYTFTYIDGTSYASPQGIYDTITQNPDGTFTLTEPHKTVYEFDQNGVLTEIRDRNGNALHFQYDPAGKLPIIGTSVFSNEPEPKIIAYDYKLATIIDTVGREIIFGYDDNGRLITITDFSGRVYSYAYDPSVNGDLLHFTTPPTQEYPQGLTTAYSYDTEHNLKTITDAKGQTYLTNHYDANDRVYLQDYGQGHFSFSYDSPTQTTITDPKGFVTVWTCDLNGNPTSKKEYTAGLRPGEPAFYETTYSYNNNLERTSVIYPKGNGITYAFDQSNPNQLGRGNLTKIRRHRQQLTDNLALGKPTTASAEYSSQFSAANAVDGIITEPTQAGYWLLPNYTAGWIQVDLQAVYDITTLRWLNTHNNGFDNFTTIDWHIDASVNGTDFATVANGTESFSPSPTWVIREISSTPARYIRFYVDSYYMWGGGVNEIEAYSASENDISTTFTYEPNFNFIKTSTDPEGNTTTFTYDYELPPQDPHYGTAGNVVKISYPAVTEGTPETRFTYNQYGQLQTVTDPNNNTTHYEYYASTGYLWKIIQDPGSAPHLNYVTEFTYDAVGNPLTIKNTRGYTSTYEYNALNQLTKTIAPAPFNYQTKYSYDENGNLEKIERQTNNAQNPWQATEYAYTALDQLETIKQYLSSGAWLLTSFSYDLNGNRQSVTDPEQNTTTYDFDERNLIWKTTDALLHTTEYSYDSNGNVEVIKDANAHTTSYLYDDFDRLEKATYADNSFQRFSYDKNSNLKAKNTNDDPEAQIAYDYDTLNRLDFKTYPDASIVDYGYDVGSRLTSIENPASRIDYQYDVVNRIKTATNTLNAIPYTLSYQYDQAGNRTQLIYPSGQVFNYTYDSLDRPSQIKQGNSILAQYTYDALSRRTQKELYNQKTKRTLYTYDWADRLLSVKNYVPTSSGGGCFLAGTPILLADGSSKNIEDVKTGDQVLSFDEKTQALATAFVKQTFVVEADSYLLINRELKVTDEHPFYAKGKWVPAKDLKAGDELQTHDGRLEPLSSIERIQKHAQVYNIEAGPYNTFFASGYLVHNKKIPVLPKTSRLRPGPKETVLALLGTNVRDFLSIRDAEANPGKVSSQFTYTYDNAGNRLTMSAPNGTHSYTYDDTYQLTDVSYPQGSPAAINYGYDNVGNRDIVTIDAAPTDYVPNSLNQYSSVGGQSYAYGQQGNLESDGIHTFGYDVENRLITAQDATRTTHYEYDGFGRRIAKTVDGVTTSFIYDGDQVIEERNELGALAKDYIYGSGIDEILSSTRYAPNTIRSFYFYDGLGSVTDITQANGEVVESYSYDVFGKASIKSQSGQTILQSAIGNRFMFTGREYDAETELYDFRNRTYSPTIGRFLQRDPLEIDDENTYNYCYNDPINWVDPYGYQGTLPYSYPYPPVGLPSVGPDIFPPFGEDLGLPAPPFPGQYAPLNAKRKETYSQQKGLSESMTYYAAKKEPKEKDKEKKSLLDKLKEWWKKHGINIVNKPSHKGIDLPGKKNIIHLGKDPRYGKTGRHIGIWHKGPMESRWHIDF